MVTEKNSKMNFYKDNYDLLDRQCQSVREQNKDYFTQIMEFKKNIMTLEDRVRQFEDKQYSDSFKKV